MRRRRGIVTRKKTLKEREADMGIEVAPDKPEDDSQESLKLFMAEEA